MGHALLKKPIIVNDTPGQCTSIHGHLLNLSKGTCTCERCGAAAHFCETDQGAWVDDYSSDEFGFDIITHYEREYCPTCGYEHYFDPPAHGTCDKNNDCVCDFCGLGDHLPTEAGKEKILILGTDGYNHHLGKFTCKKCGKEISSEELYFNRCRYNGDFDPPHPKLVGVDGRTATCDICGELYCASSEDHHRRYGYRDLKNHPVQPGEDITDDIDYGTLHEKNEFKCVYCNKMITPTHDHTIRSVSDVIVKEGEYYVRYNLDYCEECGYMILSNADPYPDPNSCSHDFETIEATETYTVVRCIHCKYTETYYW